MTMLKGFLSEAAKPIPILAPVNTTGSTWASDVINLAKYSHVTILVQVGAWAGGTSTMTVEYTNNNTQTTDTPMAFRQKTAVMGAGATDTLGALTDVSSSGTAITVANTTYVIELDASEIATADSNAGNSRIIVKGTSPGSNNDYICIWAVLTNPRYASDVPASAID